MVKTKKAVTKKKSTVVKTTRQPEDLLLAKVLKILEDKKAEEICFLNVQKLTDYTDYFVFCSGNSKIHLQSLADGLDRELRKEKLHVKESGERDSGWLIVDCGMVIVHCLGKAERVYYNLEELWREADVVYHHY